MLKIHRLTDIIWAWHLAGYSRPRVPMNSTNTTVCQKTDIRVSLPLISTCIHFLPQSIDKKKKKTGQEIWQLSNLTLAFDRRFSHTDLLRLVSSLFLMRSYWTLEQKKIHSGECGKSNVKGLTFFFCNLGIERMAIFQHSKAQYAMSHLLHN